MEPATGLRLAALVATGHPDPRGLAAEFSGSERTVGEGRVPLTVLRTVAGLRDGAPRPWTYQRLPGGSWRVKVYAGIDPLTGHEIRLPRTFRAERAAQIELGKLLAQAVAGRQPDSAVTVAQLLDQYVLTAGWDVSSRESNLGYIRRTIKPAIGSTQVRKVRGPLLDTLYARLMRCGNLTCTGKAALARTQVPGT